MASEFAGTTGLTAGVSWPVAASWAMAVSGLVLLVLVCGQLFRQHAKARRDSAGGMGTDTNGGAGDGVSGGGGVRERMEAVRRLAEKENDLRRVIAEAQHAAGAMIEDLERAAERVESLLERANEVGEKSRRDYGGEGDRRRPGAAEGTASEDGEAARELGLTRTGAMSERVGELAERGLSPVQIAQMLDQPVGTVELILALRRV